MEGVIFIRDLAVVMLTAGIAAWVCLRLKLSLVVGYLLAGVIVGPYTPPFALVEDVSQVQMLAQVGLVFQIFAIGTDLSIGRLRRLGPAVLVATAAGALVMLGLCRIIGGFLGLTWPQVLVLGGMVMVSSSAIISRVLEELNLTHERAGQLALGVTVLEDLVAIVMLTLITSVIQMGASSTPVLLPTMGKLTGLLAVVAVLSLLLVPRVLDELRRKAAPEIRTLIVTGLLLGLAWLTVHFGYSLALGAFVLGAIIGSTRHKADLAEVFEGVRHIFGAVFFVAFGMLVDFRLVRDVWPQMLGLAGIAMFLRPIACTIGLSATGIPLRHAGRAGLLLVPLGEFSFILAQVGVQGGVVPPGFFPMAIGAALITSAGAPLMARFGEPWVDRFLGREPLFLQRWAAWLDQWTARLRRQRTLEPLERLADAPIAADVRDAFRRASQSTASSSWTDRLGEAPAEWGVELDEFTLPRDSALAGLTLGKVALRRKFGCTVVGIDRQGLPLSNPGADTVLFPRDKLLVLGPQEKLETVAGLVGQAAAAERLSNGFEELFMETLRVPADSPLIGRSLLDLDLIRRAGIQLGGIRSSTRRIVPPNGADQLEGGDEVLVLGSVPQLERFKQLLVGVPDAATGTAGTDLSLPSTG